MRTSLKIYSKVLMIFCLVISIIACPAPTSGGGGGSTVETPLITPPAGSIEQDTAQISITCVTSGAVIHYTDDDTAPTSASPEYAGPIAVSAYPEGALHIKALAVKSGSANSAVASADYSVTDNIGPAPIVSSVASGGVNAPFDITITFNEPIAADADPAHEFTQSDLEAGLANATVSAFDDSANPVFTATINPTAVGDVTIDVLAGVCTDDSTNLNPNIASSQFSIYYDPNAPLPTITSSASDPTNASPIPITVTFDRDVADFDLSDITVGNGSASNFAGGPAVFTADVVPAGQGSVTVDVAAGVCTSTTGSPNAAAVQFGIVYDTVSPAVTIDQASAQNDPANGTIDFTVVFSEPVADFATGDVTLSGTAGATTAVVTGSGATYNVAVSGMAGDGTVIASLAAGVAHDAAGNASGASTSTDDTVTYDGTAPTVTIDQAGGQNDPTNASPVNFTVVFSESVSDFATGDVTLSGTAGADTATVTGSGTTYNVAVSGMTGDGTVIASLAAGVAHDAAGNASEASTAADNTVTYDSSQPAVTIDQAGAQADPTNGGTVNFTVIFSKSVSDFTTGDVTLSGTAGAATAVVTGSGTTYNAAVSGMTGDGTVIATIAAGVAHDGTGNPNTASISTDNTVTYDTTAPGLTLSSTALNPINAGFTVTFTFTEEVTGFTASDIAFTAGTGSASVPSTSDNIVWTSIISPSSQGTVTVTVDAAAVQDLAGNSSTAAANSITRTYDSIAPTVTVEQAGGQADPTNASPINFTVVFSESVTDFATGDVTLTGTAGAATGTVTGSGTTYNVAVSGMTGDGTVIASLAVGMAHDAAGNGNDASTSTDNTVSYDGTAPTVTVDQAGGQADPTHTSPVNFTVVFSESVSDFATGDVTITGTAGGSKTATVTGSGTTYNVAVTGMTTDGTIIASIAAGAAHDAVGNASSASTSGDNTVSWDGTAPDVVVSTAAPDPTSVDPIPFSFSFSETVTGFTAADITVTNGTAGNLQTSNDRDFTADISVTGAPTDNVTVTVNVYSMVCTDQAGNGNNSGTPVTVHFNGTSVGFTTYQGASVVIGQPDFTSNSENQGGSVGANTYTKSYGNPTYAGGKLFLPDYGNNRVLVFNSIPAANNTAADYVIGQPSLTSNTAGTSSTVISGPESVSCNGTKLIIDDYTNNRVLVYNSIPSFSGAAADVVVGQTDFTSSSSGLSASKINGAESAFITSNDKLLIADSVNNRVLIFNSIPASNGASADVVLGQANFTSNGSGCSQSALHTPTDVWSDGARVIVSDADNNRLLIWNTFPTSNNQPADVVVGQNNFTSNSNGTAVNKFRRPWEFTASPSADQLIVTDLDNHRVLIFNSIPTSNGANADVVLGQPDFTTRTAACTQSGLNWPCGAAVLDDTSIVVIDANNSRALIYTGL
ncbi:MAG: chitobiase/beta-hexosaminidase C-terminal domain-containing protein [Spirochaetales bacterium]|nr:chitobiase/beta-hexosaminidase C-terminal domain-containing protein [Spirochaetales bacterium]